MANKIRGDQIKDATITNTQISGSASIDLSKLAEPVIQADGGQNFSADQSMNGNKLTSVGTPTLDGDAVNKAYVDAAIDGLDRKEAVRFASTQDLASETFGTTGVTYANGTSGVGATLTQDDATDGTFGGLDGVTTGLAVSQRVLIMDQTSALENGIYEITNLGNGTTTPWVLTRTTDADSITELHKGTFVFVKEGTTKANHGYVVTSDVTAIGTSAVTWTQTTGAGQITAGTGMVKDGDTLNVQTANAGILANADNIELQVDATAATIAVGGAGIQIADGTAGYLLIGKGAGTDTAFTEVTGDVTISSAGVAAISSGAIVDGDVSASAAISLSKLASGTDGYVIVCNGSGVPTYVAMSGDATISNTGVVTLAAAVLKTTDEVVQDVPTETPNGVITAFTLGNTPADVTKVKAYVNGVRQKYGGGDAFTVSGTTATFNAGWIPQTADDLYFTYFT